MNDSQGVMRIGEVHAQLRKYFPDIELSKIRYYEDKGLVQPSRSRKGYRLYSERDVECLREAIRLAQEEFVPLRVVRLRLIEQGLLKDVPVASAPRHAAREAVTNVVSIPVPAARPNLTVVPPTVETTPPSDQRNLTMTAFLVATGLDASSVHQLHSLGLLAPLNVAGELTFTDFDVLVASTANALLQRGLDVRLLGSLRRVAEREVGVLDDLAAPLRSKASGLSSEQIQSETAELARDVATLRGVLYERALADYLNL